MNIMERVERSLLDARITTSHRIAVACSGGGDSVALLHIILQLGIKPVVLHVNHGLRPEADADALWVGELAERLGCDVYVARVDVLRTGSIEAAAREARYEALRKAADELDLHFVLTAHTLDDQAETVVLRATRGGSLAGIAPKRDIFVRPLLDITRAELRDWMSDRDVDWRDDPSNEDASFERNWVRNVVMPQLRGRRAGVVAVLARHAQRAREDAEVLDDIAAQAFAGAAVDDAGLLMDISGLPTAIARRVVRLAFRAMGVDPTEGDIDVIVQGRRLREHGIEVWSDSGALAFVRDPVPAPSPIELQHDVFDAPQWGVRLRIGEPGRAPWTWRSFVPPGSITIRSRHAGDRIKTSGGTKKIHDVLIDAKIPRALRDLVPIVATKDEAIAVVGLTRRPEGERVIDVEPLHPTWSKATVWTRA